MVVTGDGDSVLVRRMYEPVTTMVSSVPPDGAPGGGGPLVSAPAKMGISSRQQAMPLTASRFIAYLPVFQVMRAPAAFSKARSSPHPRQQCPPLASWSECILIWNSLQ